MMNSKNTLTYGSGKWDKGTYKGYTYWVKHYDEPSEDFGWKGSRISKMEIRNKNGKTTFNYDRGMDIDAQDKGTLKVLDYLMTIFG